MFEDHVIDMENPHHKFCVSWVSIRTSCVGTKLFVQSWNNHPFPTQCQLIQYLYYYAGKINSSRGAPVDQMRSSRIFTINEHLIQSPNEALQMYRNVGETITDSHDFGFDP